MNRRLRFTLLSLAAILMIVIAAGAAPADVAAPIYNNTSSGSASDSAANSSSAASSQSSSAAQATGTGIGSATVNSNFSNSIQQSLFAGGGAGGQGGQGGSGGSGGTGGSAGANANPIISTSVNAGGTHIPHQAPMAYAPTILPINCNQSVSLGVSSPYGGLGAGWTTPDNECNGLRLGTQLYVMGKTAEAMDVICHLKMAEHIANCEDVIEAAEERREAKAARQAARKSSGGAPDEWGGL